MSHSTTPSLKPLPPARAVLPFLIVGVLLRLSVYRGVPWLEGLGIPSYYAFIVAFTTPLALLFVLALVGARREGARSAAELAARFRLHRLGWRDLGWVLAGTLVLIVSGVLLASWTHPLIRWMGVDLPDSFPVLIDPRQQNAELPGAVAEWIGPVAAGTWLPIAAILALFFFNIFGEELYWRGLLLPRQELVHGRNTWWVHGLMWNLFHVPIYPWYLIAGLPITLTLSFIAQRTGNTWVPILLHTLANITLVLLVVGVVAGGG